MGKGGASQGGRGNGKGVPPCLGGLSLLKGVRGRMGTGNTGRGGGTDKGGGGTRNGGGGRMDGGGGIGGGGMGMPGGGIQPGGGMGMEPLGRRGGTGGMDGGKGRIGKGGTGGREIPAGTKGAGLGSVRRVGMVKGEMGEALGSEEVSLIIK